MKSEKFIFEMRVVVKAEDEYEARKKLQGKIKYQYNKIVKMRTWVCEECKCKNGMHYIDCSQADTSCL